MVAQKLCPVASQAKFCRRVFTASIDVLTTKPTGMRVASVPACAGWFRSMKVRALPRYAKFRVVASFAVVAAAIALSNRIFASANISAGVISWLRLIAALHIDSPRKTRLYPAYAYDCPISFMRFGTSASLHPSRCTATVSPTARAIQRGIDGRLLVGAARGVAV